LRKLHTAPSNSAPRTKGRSTEAGIGHVLVQPVAPKNKLKIGSELAAFDRRSGGIALNLQRDHRPIEPAELE
jgi:hypothetical protein